MDLKSRIERDIKGLEELRKDIDRRIWENKMELHQIKVAEEELKNKKIKNLLVP